MPAFNLGNVVGLIKSQTPPTKTYVVWGKILNPSFPDLVELNYYDALTSAWTPVTDPTTQHWLRPVLSNTLTAPPGTPNEGDRYLIPVGATGAWNGKTDQIATWRSGNWVFQIPLDGFIVSVRTEANKLYDYRGLYAGGGVWAENDFQVPVAPGTYLLATSLGVPLGVADLDSSGKIAASRINGQHLPYTPLIPGNWPGGTDTIWEALDYLILNIGGSGSAIGSRLERNVAKAAHGFIVGNVLTTNGSGEHVKVTNAATQKPIGIVTAVTDADNVKMGMAGLITGLAGLTPGAIYYVQNTGVISTSVTQAPYLLALNATDGYILGGGGGAATLSEVLTTGNSAGNQQIKNVLNPTDPQDADTRSARDTAISTAISNLVNSAPGVLDTLYELATALGNDPNFATTVATQLALKANAANAALTGVPVAPTAALGTNTTQIATTAFVQKELGHEIIDLGNLTGAVTIDLSLGRKFKATQTGNITSFTFTGEILGASYLLDLTRTANHTFALTAGKFRVTGGVFSGVTNPTLNGSGTSVDKFSFECAVAGRLDLVITPDLQNI